MEIRSVKITNIYSGALMGCYEGLRHIKVLPYLSVVQPLHGSYEVALDGKSAVTVGEKEAFVAPAGVEQDILHHNGEGGHMHSHWVFMNVIINDLFAPDDVFRLPKRITSEHAETLYRLITTVAENASLCKRYAAAYELTDLLISLSKEKEKEYDSAAAHLKRYIDEHYSERMTKEDLAAVAYCSVTNLYRIFKRHFALSPHNYINKVRLEKAALLLEISDRPVSAIAAAVGFDDPTYFSRLFKETFLHSPTKYREVLANTKKG